MRISYLIPILSAFILLSSCQKREDTDIPAGYGDIRFSCSASQMTQTKSYYPVSEDALKTAAVALYDHEGLLARSGYFNDLSDIYLKAILGRTYTVYAVFNVGAFDFPGFESDLKAKSFTWDNSYVVTHGFPFAWSGQVEFTSEGQAVAIDAERIISKVNFKVDNSGLSGHNGKFVVDSLFLKNCPKEYYPFDTLKTEGLKDFKLDYATINDLTTLNSGGTASFYTLENRRGTLLPGNTDPWKKIPANIGTDADRCTYLEVTGRYSTDRGTLTAPVKYKMYIGSDVTTNFDLNRNEIYNVTLKPSDKGIDSTSWKITVGEFEDKRSIKFSPDTVKMSLATPSTFRTLPAPSDMECRVEGYDSAGLKLTVSSTGIDNEWIVSASGTIANDTVVHLKASSWDGRTTADVPVMILVKQLQKIVLTPADVLKSQGETQEYTVKAIYDNRDTIDVTAGAGTTYESSDTNVAVMGTGAKRNVATARNSGESTITAMFGGMKATAKFIIDYPVSLSANCEGYGDTGDWKWDFYKIGASATPSYTVTAKYYSGKTRLLSTSEYTVSDNTGSEYVDFSTNGIVKMVGTDVNTGCKASVKFSYTEAGKTVTLTKTWWKLYVTRIEPSVTSRGKNGVFYDETVEAKARLYYNDDSGETVSWPSELGTLSGNNEYVDMTGHSVTGKLYGSTSVTSTGKFRTVQLSGTVKSWRHCSLSSSQGGSFHTLDGGTIGSYTDYYCVSIDAEGVHYESGGTIIASHGRTYSFTGSVSGKTLIEKAKEYSSVSNFNIYCGGCSSCPLSAVDYTSQYDLRGKYVIQMKVPE